MFFLVEAKNFQLNNNILIIFNLINQKFKNHLNKVLQIIFKKFYLKIKSNNNNGYIIIPQIR